MKPKLMNAKFPGKCKVCGTRFSAGTPILWTKAGGATCTDDCGGSVLDPLGTDHDGIPFDADAAKAWAQHCDDMRPDDWPDGTAFCPCCC